MAELARIRLISGWSWWARRGDFFSRNAAAEAGQHQLAGLFGAGKIVLLKKSTCFFFQLRRRLGHRLARRCIANALPLLRTAALPFIFGDFRLRRLATPATLSAFSNECGPVAAAQNNFSANTMTRMSRGNCRTLDGVAGQLRPLS